MYYLTLAMNWAVRICGSIVVVLGLFFWTGRLLEFLPLHMVLGLVLIAALWILALLAIFKGVMSAFGVFALAWGALVVAVGMMQDSFLPGDAHWIVKSIHLLLGLSAIFVAQRLSRALQNSERKRG
jgi:hypothetical protein